MFRFLGLGTIFTLVLVWQQLVDIGNVQARSKALIIHRAPIASLFCQ